MNKLTVRKIALAFLFILLLLCQFLIFRSWFTHQDSQENISKSFYEIIKPNQSLFYSNEATKNFVDAGISFNEYLQSRNPKFLKNYQSSINNMSAYLDSLNALSKTDKDFSKIINAKKGAEKNVSLLQKQLDSLINDKLSTEKVSVNFNFKIQKYDYDKVLSSITYDTVQKITESKKKSLFGRIGNALSGKSEVEKQEVQSTIKMVFNNQVKSGTFEEQLRNTFKLTEDYYNNNFKKLRNTYTNLKKSDNNLLKINKLVFKKSQEILLFYSKSAQEATVLNYINSTKKYNSDSKDQEETILKLLVLMGIGTILLLLYTVYAYIREIEIAKAKAIVDKNLDKKNQLIGMLSHEMRAPLNIISNYSNKLKKRNQNLELEPTIKSIEFASNSLQITVSQILDFIKNENNKLKLYNTKINLIKEIQPIVESLKSLSEVKNITIISHLDKSLDTNVWGDNVKIHQLFYNFIVNAIKFTKEGSITINAKLKTIENKYRLDVSIIDTGVGIPQEDIKNIFDKFYQSEKHKDQSSKGAGLGLDLCKNIVEMHQGTIQVTSELNKGTEISFFLLFEKLDADHETFQTQLENKFKNQKIKIAIVDDDSIMLGILKKLITKVGFEAITYNRAPEIKEYLNHNVVDAIITDIQIFDYSGIELFKDIKKINNANNTKPIIAITGDPYLYSSEERTLGFDEIIIKPINKEEFYQKIINVL